MASARDTLNACLALLGKDNGHRFRVAIYGSARLTEGSPSYMAIFWFAARLIRLGIDVVTGGGPGVMAAANGGAAHQKRITPNAQARSIGVPIVLPFEQGTNPGVSHVFNTEDFGLRLDVFGVLSCCHVVAEKGGIGTLLELFKFLQLHQIQKYQGMENTNSCLFPMHPSVQIGYIPWIIVVGPLYDRFFDLLSDMDVEGTLKMRELSFLKRADDYDEAMKLVITARKKWRRYLRNREMKDVIPLN